MFNLVEAGNLWMLMHSVMHCLSTWVIYYFAALESAFDFLLSYLLLRDSVNPSEFYNCHFLWAVTHLESKIKIRLLKQLPLSALCPALLTEIASATTGSQKSSKAPPEHPKPVY